MIEYKKIYENYLISSNGKIYSLKSKKVLKPIIQDNGYSYVTIHNNKIQKMFRLHRLVAETFIPNPNNLPQVNHKDENKQNNKVENLEWCTAKYNMNYGTRKERVAEMFSKKVYQYTLDGELVKVWSSTMECGRNGYNQSKIVSCCNGKRKSHKGYKWNYGEIEN